MRGYRDKHHKRISKAFGYKPRLNDPGERLQKPPPFHAWLKLEQYTFRCIRCGLRREFRNDPSTGEWTLEYHTPEGDVFLRTIPCPEEQHGNAI